MKSIKRIEEVKPGFLLCSPRFKDRRAKLHISGQTPANILVRVLDRPSLINGVERSFSTGNVTLTCGNHVATIESFPHWASYTLTNATVDFEKWKDEPILSVFPVVLGGIILWRRAYGSLQELSTDDISVSSDDFGGILPIVVAAACRGTCKIASDVEPRDGLFRSVANLLQVEVLKTKLRDTK